MDDTFEELKHTVAETLASSGVLNKIKAELRVGVFQALDKSGQIPDEFYTTLRKLNQTKEGHLCLVVIHEFLQTMDLRFTAEVFRAETNLKDLTDLQRLNLKKELTLPSENQSEPSLLTIIRQYTAQDSSKSKKSDAAKYTQHHDPISPKILRSASRAFSRADSVRFRLDKQTLQHHENINSIPMDSALNLLKSFFPSVNSTSIAEALGDIINSDLSKQIGFEEYLSAFVHLSYWSAPIDSQDIAEHVSLPSDPVLPVSTREIDQQPQEGSKLRTDLPESDDPLQSDFRINAASSALTRSSNYPQSNIDEANSRQSQQMERAEDTTDQMFSKYFSDDEKTLPISSSDQREAEAIHKQQDQPARFLQKNRPHLEGSKQSHHSIGRQNINQKETVSSLLGDLPTFSQDSTKAVGALFKKDAPIIEHEIDDLFGVAQNQKSRDENSYTENDKNNNDFVAQLLRRKPRQSRTAGIASGKDEASVHSTRQGGDLLNEEEESIARQGKSLFATSNTDSGAMSVADSRIASFHPSFLEEGNLKQGSIKSTTGHESDESFAEEIEEEQSFHSHVTSLSDRSNPSRNGSLSAHGNNWQQAESFGDVRIKTPPTPPSGSSSRSHHSSKSSRRWLKQSPRDNFRHTDEHSSPSASEDDVARLQEVEKKLVEMQAKMTVENQTSHQTSNSTIDDKENNILNKTLTKSRDSIDLDSENRTPIPGSEAQDSVGDYEQDFEDYSEVSEEIVTEDFSEHFSGLSISHGPSSQHSADNSAMTEDFSIGSAYDASKLLYYTKA